MKYCQKCGRQSDDGSQYCTNCGAPLGLPTNQIVVNNIIQDEGSIGGGICLGLFLNVLGLFISLFCKRKTMKGAIIGYLFSGLIIFIAIIALYGTLLPYLAAFQN